MKARNIVLLFALALVGLTQVASAGIKAGLSEINGSVSYENMSGDSDASMLTLSGTYNRFISDNMSLGLTVLALRTESDGDTTSLMFLMVRGDYYFPIQANTEWVPYAGLRLGMVAVDASGSSDNAMMYGPQVGMKKFINESTSVNVELAYTRYTIGDSDVNDVGVSVGLSVYY